MVVGVQKFISKIRFVMVLTKIKIKYLNVSCSFFSWFQDWLRGRTDSQRAGRKGFWIPAEIKDFSLLLNSPHELWGPLNLLFKWVLGFLAGATLPECEVKHPPQTLLMRGGHSTLPGVKRGNFTLCCPHVQNQK